MRFKVFLEADEQNQVQGINAIFQKAAADIKQWLLTDIKQGLTSAIQSAQKSDMPEQLAQSIMQDLQRIAGKLRGVRSPQTPPSNIQRDPAVQDSVIHVMNALKEAEAVAPGVSQGVGASGKRLLTVDTALNDIYTKIINKMNELRVAVLNQMGLIQGIHSRTGEIQQGVQGMQQGMQQGFQGVQSKIKGVLNRTGEIRNKVDKLLQGPAQPFDAQTSRSAENAMDELQSLKGSLGGGSLKLLSRDGKEIEISNRDSDWRSEVMSSSDRRFVLAASYGGKEINRPIDIGHSDTIYRLAELIKSQFGAEGKPFVPQPTPDTSPEEMKSQGFPSRRTLQAPTKKGEKAMDQLRAKQAAAEAGAVKKPEQKGTK